MLWPIDPVFSTCYGPNASGIGAVSLFRHFTRRSRFTSMLDLIRASSNGSRQVTSAVGDVIGGLIHDYYCEAA